MGLDCFAIHGGDHHLVGCGGDWFLVGNGFCELWRVGFCGSFDGMVVVGHFVGRGL